MKQSAVEFTADGERVDGILASPAGIPAVHRQPPSTAARRYPIHNAPLEEKRQCRPFPAVVVCHPHPLLGGDMNSSIVTAICRALAGRGIASLRFNFRRPAAGQSDPEELDAGAARDVAAAFDLVQHWRDARPNRCAVAGYSFGAAAIAHSIENLRAARAFALIAPPISSLADSTLLTDTRPILLLVGENDQLVPATELRALAGEMTDPVSFESVEGADHFFHAEAGHVAERVASFLAAAIL